MTIGDWLVATRTERGTKSRELLCSRELSLLEPTAPSILLQENTETRALRLAHFSLKIAVEGPTSGQHGSVTPISDSAFGPHVTSLAVLNRAYDILPSRNRAEANNQRLRLVVAL
jgi:hypothetical protein